MKKIILALALAFGLGACSVTDGVNALSTAIVGTTNPVTKNDLYAFENSMIVAFAGLNAYKKSCIAGAADVNCRANVAKLQVYTRRIPAALATTRAFVRQNDTVNAQIAYTALKQLFADFTAVATANNVRVQ